VEFEPVKKFFNLEDGWRRGHQKKGKEDHTGKEVKNTANNAHASHTSKAREEDKKIIQSQALPSTGKGKLSELVLQEG